MKRFKATLKLFEIFDEAKLRENFKSYGSKQKSEPELSFKLNIPGKKEPMKTSRPTSGKTGKAILMFQTISSRYLNVFRLQKITRAFC